MKFLKSILAFVIIFSAAVNGHSQELHILKENVSVCVLRSRRGRINVSLYIKIKKDFLFCNGIGSPSFYKYFILCSIPDI